MARFNSHDPKQRSTGQLGSISQYGFSPAVINFQNACCFFQVSGRCRLGLVRTPVDHERCVCTGYPLRGTEVGDNSD